MMHVRWVATLAISASLSLLVSPDAISAPEQIWQTKEKQSPIIKCVNSTCSNVYNYAPPVFKERIGKKLAIRSIYLIPTYGVSKRLCETDAPKRNDLYEVAFVYLEVQSIWPEPFLLTAAKIDVKTSSRFIHLSAGMRGGSVLDPQITSNWEPGYFLFKPAEIKFIGLSQGMKLDGILEFFKGEVLSDVIWDEHAPVLIPNLARVAAFNRFLQQRFGASTTVRIQLFEKDYQPLLTTEVKLAQGGNLFSNGDVPNSKFQFKHDAFIGEVLYQLRGGSDIFDYRLKKVDRTGDPSVQSDKR